jgi:hypothetical protein
MEESQVKRGRGRPKKIIRKTIRKDLEVNELDPNMVFDRTLWRHLIHVADPTWWDKAWWLLVVVIPLPLLGHPENTLASSPKSIGLQLRGFFVWTLFESRLRVTLIC